MRQPAAPRPLPAAGQPTGARRWRPGSARPIGGDQRRRRSRPLLTACHHRLLSASCSWPARPTTSPRDTWARRVPTLLSGQAEPFEGANRGRHLQSKDTATRLPGRDLRLVRPRSAFDARQAVTHADPAIQHRDPNHQLWRSLPGSSSPVTTRERQLPAGRPCANASPQPVADSTNDCAENH